MYGQEASDLFAAFHPRIPSQAKALSILQNMPVVARLREEDRDNSKLYRDFCNLRTAIENDGTYDTSYRYYIVQAMWLLILFSTALLCTMAADGVVQLLLSAAVFALFLQQAAFVGHDAGHTAISHKRYTDSIIGIVVGPLLTGVSFSWWKDSHNTHHAKTNEIEHDPDIQHLPMLCLSVQALKTGQIFSTYHKIFFKIDRITLFFLRRQDVLFVPLIFLSRFNLYLQSVLWFFRWRSTHMSRKFRLLEIMTLLTHHVLILTLLQTIDGLGQRLLWYLTTNIFASYLNLQIVSSHFGMDLISEKTTDLPVGAHFLQQQLKTTTDIHTSRCNAWFYGGLQHQVTHHIFPRVPRHNLQGLSLRIKKLCNQHQLIYNEEYFLCILSNVLLTLKNVSREAVTMTKRGE